MNISRRRFTSLSAALLLSPSVGRADTTLRKVRVGTIPIVDVTPLQAAIKLGYFRDVGLDVDTSPAPGGAATLPALAAGQLDFAFSNTVSTLLGISEGIDFRFVAAGCSTAAQPPDLAGLVARKVDKITSGAQLGKRRVAVNNRNNIMSVRTAAWIDQTGGKWQDATFVEIPFPQMADALLSGQVDAAIINEPFLTVALKKDSDKLGIVSWPMSQTAPAGVVSQYISTERTIDAKPDIAEAFAKALGKGVAWTRSNVRSAAGEELISGFTRIPPDRLRDSALPIFDSVIAPEKIKALAEVLVTQRLINPIPDLQRAIYKTGLVDYS